MIICPVCGNRNPDGTAFCGECGADLRRKDVKRTEDVHNRPESRKKAKKKGKGAGKALYIIMVVALAAIAAVVWLEAAKRLSFRTPDEMNAKIGKTLQYADDLGYGRYLMDGPDEYSCFDLYGFEGEYVGYITYDYDGQLATGSDYAKEVSVHVPEYPSAAYIDIRTDRFNYKIAAAAVICACDDSLDKTDFRRIVESEELDEMITSAAEGDGKTKFRYGGKSYTVSSNTYYPMDGSAEHRILEFCASFLNP